METVAIDTRLDGRLAVLVRPAEPGPWPGVVMVHEAWGLDDVLRRQANRLASAGQPYGRGPGEPPRVRRWTP